MKKILILTKLFFFILITSGFSQTMPQFSQRSFEMHVVNPASIGSKLSHTLQIHSRNQWIGFEGSPNTQILSYTGTLRSNTGLGGYIFKDETGPTRNIGANIGYAYHLILDKLNISFGLSASLSKYRFLTEEIDFHEEADPLSVANIDSKLVPDATAGLFVYNKKFYAGISSTYLIESRIKDVEASYIPTSVRYFAMAGYNIGINDKINLIPNAFAAFSTGTQYQAEFGVRAEFSNFMMGGVNFRTNDAVVLLFGLKIKKQYLVSYSYDVIYTQLRSYNSGSHEIIFAYLFDSWKSSQPMYFKSNKRSNRRAYWD